MRKGLKTLETIAFVLALIIGIIGSMFFLAMVAMLGSSWHYPHDHIAVASVFFYFVGVFSGLRWKGIGGLLILFMSTVFVSSQIHFAIKHPSSGDTSTIIFMLIVGLIMMIPGVLFLTIRYFRNRIQE